MISELKRVEPVVAGTRLYSITIGGGLLKFNIFVRILKNNEISVISEYNIITVYRLFVEKSMLFQHIKFNQVYLFKYSCMKVTIIIHIIQSLKRINRYIYINPVKKLNNINPY